MKCKNCKAICIKKGFQRNGTQRYYCKICKRYQQGEYIYTAWNLEINQRIIKHVKGSSGIRDISVIEGISINTVMKRILSIAASIEKPTCFVKGKQYEMDELKTYIGKKQNRYWIAYALRRDTTEIVDFRVGKRSNKTLRPVIETLLLSEAKTIYTDGFRNYGFLIPGNVHKKRKYQINHIERKNLNLRTHLKRLSRRTICYSKSLLMLSACLKIYFWG